MILSSQLPSFEFDRKPVEEVADLLTVYGVSFGVGEQLKISAAADS